MESTKYTEEKVLDDKLNDLGLNEPRLRPADIDALIVSRRFFVDETFVICVVELRNGHKVVGTSRPVSDANFKQDIGEEIAFKNAREKVWELAGYELRSRLNVPS